MNKQVLNILHELAATREQFWNISPEVGKFLNLLIRGEKFQNVLEIGTSNGYSGLWLAEALSHAGGTLYTIESNAKKRYPLAEANFARSGLTNIHLILGHAPEVIPSQPQEFDLAFFDATKCEHQLYFNALKNRIKPGGLIITDNAVSHSADLAEYFAIVEKEPNWQSQLLNLGTGLFISQKSA